MSNNPEKYTSPATAPQLFPTDEIASTSGFCSHCGVNHTIPMAGALGHCLELIHHFQKNETIDLNYDKKTGGINRTDPRLSTGYLFGEARGKMFGVLECLDHDGSRVVLRAFSGQYNGIWDVKGWAPPLFDPAEFHQTNSPGERQIKAMGKQLQELEHGSEKWRTLRKARRQMSRQLMKELHGLYRLHNFHNEVVPLGHAYTGSNGIPTGTGDCCAPKLLNLAARRKLIPISIAEFYWGLANKSNTRHHGRFYPSCQDKCQPILGYLLCGAKGLMAKANSRMKVETGDDDIRRN